MDPLYIKIQETDDFSSIQVFQDELSWKLSHMDHFFTSSNYNRAESEDKYDKPKMIPKKYTIHVHIYIYIFTGIIIFSCTRLWNKQKYEVFKHLFKLSIWYNRKYTRNYVLNGVWFFSCKCIQIYNNDAS
jgi:hypothetical protein